MSYKKEGGVRKLSFLYILILLYAVLAMYIYAKDGSFDTVANYWYSFLMVTVGGLLLMLKSSLWNKIGFTVLTGFMVALFLQGVL